MSAPVGDKPIEHWSSRLTFLMASVGFAVGLGNIWRFPYVTGENGGGAFVIIYLICAFGIGVPLVMTEWAIGRRAAHAASAAGSFRELAKEQGQSPHWGKVGGLAILAVFMLMLIYTTIAGWTMDYFVKAVSGEFVGIDAAGSNAAYESLLASPWRLGFWHTVVVVITIFVLARGVHDGIEKAVNILMPSLFFCLVVMVLYSAVVGDFGAALSFLFSPDFSQVDGETVLLALGQAFFSIGVAMATMVTYGSYLPKTMSIPQNACIVVGADTGVALLAGLAIFPLVFAHGLTPGEGTGLVFQTLPIAFGDLPGGQIFAGIFFLLLIAAAITSCIGNFEPVVAWTAERFNTTRNKAAAMAGFLMWFLGLGSVLSFNHWKDFHPLDFIPLLENKTLYDNFDYIMANFMLPIGAFLTALFVGWRVSHDAIRDELGMGDSLGFKLYRTLVRFVVPVVIAVIFATTFTG